jgi:hypothetical protein
VNKYERTLGIGIAAGVIAIILILLSQRGNIDAKVAERLEGMVVEPVTVTEYVTNNVTHTLSLTTTAYVTVTQQPVTRTVVTRQSLSLSGRISISQCQVQLRQ